MKDYFSSALFADLKGENKNSLYVGGWGDKGILVSSYKNGWSAPSAVTGSQKKGNILAMRAGKGQNDGVERLYAAYWQGSGGLTEYSWSSNAYTNTQVLAHDVGKFDIGQGRNDGVERIYAFERGGRHLHELTWNGVSYVSSVIYTAATPSAGTVHIGDGRGDHLNRVYFWAGGLYELTYENGLWAKLVLDTSTEDRYYITSGGIRRDQKPSIYVSVKSRGLYEYTWDQQSGSFDVDVISGATGGCVLGDGRGDGKIRLYVANGSKGHFTKASVVEMWASDK